MRRLICLGLLISSLAPLPATAAAPESTAASTQASLAQASELMEKSGLRLEVKSFAAFIGRALKSPEEAGLSPQAAQFMADKADIAFAPGYLEKVVQEDLAAQLNPRDFNRLLAWLDSPLGNRITALENNRTNAILTDSAARDAAGAESITPSRRKLLERLIQATNSAEVMLDIQVQMMKAIFRGIASAAEMAGKPVDLKSALQGLDKKRPMMVAQIHAQLLADYGRTYAPLSDRELKGYVQFYESEPGRKFNKATTHAINSGLTDAGETFGQLLLNGN